MPYKDPEKKRAWEQRYKDRKKVERYGPAALGVDMRIWRHDNCATGARNGRWKGGRRIRQDGYVLVRVPPDHHLRHAKGYAFEHRVVAETTLGRQLEPGEVVHHKNGDRANNDPENLEVLTQSGHRRHHGLEQGKRRKEWPRVQRELELA